MKPRIYRLREYQSIRANRDNEPFRHGEVDAAGHMVIDKNAFTKLVELVNENKGTPKDLNAEPLELLSIATRNKTKVITARNFVGTISLGDGTVIEIIPKIVSDAGNDAEYADAKKVLLNMLRTVFNISPKQFRMTDLEIRRLTILDIFIRMFVREVQAIVKRGLQSAYIAHSANEKFLKGRIDFASHIRMNIVRKDRIFCNYDLFHLNRPENRLLKTALELLLLKTNCDQNHRDILLLLLAFDDVDKSPDIDTDFATVTLDRNMAHYDTALRWCNVFLRNKSFMPLPGTKKTAAEKAYALLYPMERLFESFVATYIRRGAKDSFTVEAPGKGSYLFDEPRRFEIRPDIVLSSGAPSNTIVIDTKWKMLSSESLKNYGIAQSDMYQMYAYQKKYAAKKVIAIYPLSESSRYIDNAEFKSHHDHAHVSIRFANLLHIEDSIGSILKECESTLFTDSPPVQTSAP